MANLTIKNIPESLYQKLKETAKRNRRSINSEIIVCLEEQLSETPSDPLTNLEQIRQLRAASNRHLLTEDEIRKLKNEGRL